MFLAIQKINALCLYHFARSISIYHTIKPYFKDFRSFKCKIHTKSASSENFAAHRFYDSRCSHFDPLAVDYTSRLLYCGGKAIFIDRVGVNLAKAKSEAPGSGCLKPGFLFIVCPSVFDFEYSFWLNFNPGLALTSFPTTLPR